MIMTIMCYISMDEKNHIPKWAQPSFFALMLTVIGMGFGLNAGNSMNPARDFGPRLFTLFAGYGPEVFSYNNYGVSLKKLQSTHQHYSGFGYQSSVRCLAPCLVGGSTSS